MWRKCSVWMTQLTTYDFFMPHNLFEPICVNYSILNIRQSLNRILWNFDHFNWSWYKIVKMARMQIRMSNAIYWQFFSFVLNSLSDMTLKKLFDIIDVVIDIHTYINKFIYVSILWWVYSMDGWNEFKWKFSG